MVPDILRKLAFLLCFTALTSQGQVTLPTALDTPTRTYLTEGDADWTGQTGVSHDGVDAARSGYLTSTGQTSAFWTTVTGPATVSFWWKHNTTTETDELWADVDTVEAGMHLNGNHSAWQQGYVDIPEGDHDVRWACRKDGDNSGSDYAYVDQIVVSPITQAPLIISSLTPPAVFIGDVFDYAIAAVRLPTGYTALNLPAWATFDETMGTINGTPTAAGVFNVTIKATNIIGTTSATLKITVLTPVPVIDSPAIAYGSVADPFGYQISGTHLPDAYSVVGLPAGLHMDTTPDAPTPGLIEGTPTTPGVYTMTVKATNSYGTGSKTVTVYIDNGLPQITGELSTIADFVDGANYTVEATRDPTHFAARHLPAGLEIDGDTGVISGIPTVPDGYYDATVEAWNVFGKTWDNLRIQVGNPSAGSNIDTYRADGIVGDLLTIPASFNNSFGVGTYSATGLPPALTIDIDTGVISGTPTAASVVDANVYLDDNGSSVLIGRVHIDIRAAIPALATALDITTAAASFGTGGAFASQTTTTHDGVDAAQSPVMSTSEQQSTVEITVPGPGIVRFWWKMTGDTGDSHAFTESRTGGWYDIKKSPNELYVPTDWQESSVIFQGETGGSVSWTIQMTSSPLKTTNQERLYVDQVTFTPAAEMAPVIVRNPDNFGGIYDGLTSAPGRTVEVFGAFPIDAHWTRDGTDIGSTTTIGDSSSSSSITSIDTESLPEFDVPGSYRLVASNAIGTTESGPGIIANIDYNSALELPPGWLVTSSESSGNPLPAIQSTDTHDGSDAVTVNSSNSYYNSLTIQRTSGPAGFARFWVKCLGAAGTSGYLNTMFSDVTLLSGSGWQQVTLFLPDLSDSASNFDNRITVSAPDGVGGKIIIDQYEFVPASALPPYLVYSTSGAQVREAGDLVTLYASAFNADTLQWKKNGTAIPGAYGFSLHLYNVTAADAGAYTCTFTNAAGSTTSPPATLSIAALASALDNPGGEFPKWYSQSFAGAGWGVQTTVKHDGTNALKSGAVPNRTLTDYHTGKTSLNGKFRGPGVVSFWSKISSQANRDWLYFYDNEYSYNGMYPTLPSDRTGEGDWQLQFATIPAGDYELVFEYSKDSATTAGSDSAWIDGVKFTPGEATQPTIVKQPRGVLAEAGSSVALSIETDGTASAFQWKKGTVPVAGATGPVLLIPAFAAANAGSYTCEIYSPFGTLVSNPATLALTATLGTALDNTAIKWNTETVPAWTVATSGSHDSTDSLKAPLTGSGIRTKLAGVVTGPKKLSYFTKLDGDVSELEVFIDGAVVDAAHQTSPLAWTAGYVLIPAGAHRVEFVAEQNAESSSVEAVWLDQITLSAPTWITAQPVSYLVAAGTDVTLTLTTDGLPTPYKWYKGTTLVSTGATPDLVLTGVTTASAGSYVCKMDNSLVSATVTLSVIAPASPAYAKEGGNAVLKLTPIGTGLTYKWRRGADYLSGAKYLGQTTAALTIKTVSPADEGTDYFCEVRQGSLPMLEMGPFEVKLVVQPVVDTIPPESAVVSGYLEIQLTATEFATIFKVTGLPAGLVYNPVTQKITGRPNAATATGKPLKITVIATNAWGNSAPVTFEIPVDPLPSEFIGQFTGLVDRDPDINADLGGTFSIKVTPTGDYTGAFVNGKTASVPLKGRINASTAGVGAPDSISDGNTITISRTAPLKPLLITFKIDATTAPPALTGLLEDTNPLATGLSVNLSAARVAPAVVAAGTAGKYNMSMAVPIEDLSATPPPPAGTGWMQFTIGATGAVTISARTPDGISITSSSFVDENLAVPCWWLMYGGKGSVSANPSVSPDGNVPPASASIMGSGTWNKSGPTNATDLTYAAGFPIVALSIDGTLYHAPVAAAPVFLSLPEVLVGETNARIQFPDLIDYPELTQDIRILKAGTATFDPLTNTFGVKLTALNSATGLFTGSFTLKDTTASGLVTRVVNFAGISISSSDGSPGFGVGYYLSPALPPSGTSTAGQPIFSGPVQLADPALLP